MCYVYLSSCLVTNIPRTILCFWIQISFGENVMIIYTYIYIYIFFVYLNENRNINIKMPLSNLAITECITNFSFFECYLSHSRFLSLLTFML